jgi:hypothetical protein
MGNLHSGQTAVQLNFNCSNNLTGAICTLNCVSPSGLKSTRALEQIDSGAGKLRYTLANDEDFDETGLWEFYISVVYANNKTNVSDVCKIMFNAPGE